MAKMYTVEKEINGVKYTGQFNGISSALEAIDNSYIEGTQNTSILKLSEYIFEHVIVEPKGLTPDDFESIDDFNEVVAFGRQVMSGDFRDKKNEGTTKGKSA